MSTDDLTPERLDAILNGSEPATSDAERDMLALAASLRDGSPRAGDDLRDRVRAIGAPASAPLTRQRGPGWRTRFLLAGPALATVVAAVVVIAVVGRDDPGTSRTSLTTTQPAFSGASATTATPLGAARSAADAETVAPSSTAVQPAATAGPVIIRVEPGTLARRLADARRIVAAAGGTTVVTRQTTGDPGVLLAIKLPPDRVSGALAELTRLGEGREGPATGADGTVRVLLTEGRSP